jgi:hypothetical protein
VSDSPNIPKEILKKNEQQNKCKTTKAERRKKFAKFKDIAHKSFGPTNSTGFGEGKPSFCSICNERIFKATAEFIKGKIYLYCDKVNCKDEINKLKKEREDENK